MKNIIIMKEDCHSITLKGYILEGGQKRPTILICPGGGYEFVSPRESEPVANRFNQMGYNTFVLTYSVNASPLKNKPLDDAKWAIKTIRSRCDELNVISDKIAVCGFSAGGHLAASLGVFWQEELEKPNALILSYPVITGGEFAHKGSVNYLYGVDATEQERDLFSLEKHVSQNTPPTFIWHTQDDQTVPVENAFLFATALQKHKVKLEMHIFTMGAHGLSTATADVEDYTEGKVRLADSHVARWTELCNEWLTKYVF